MSDKFQVEIPLADQVENQTVEDIWNRWVSQGVDPDEEHVVVEVVHEEIVRVIARGNLYECLVAASKAEVATRFYPAREFDEDAKRLHGMVLNAPYNDFLRTANQKFLDGDGIDDIELGALLKFYKEMEAGLRFLGPEFRIIWKEVLRRLNDLEDFKRARKAG